jgi:hypothetical protein
MRNFHLICAVELFSWTLVSSCNVERFTALPEFESNEITVIIFYKRFTTILGISITLTITGITLLGHICRSLSDDA